MIGFIANLTDGAGHQFEKLLVGCRIRPRAFDVSVIRVLIDDWLRCKKRVRPAQLDRQDFEHMPSGPPVVRPREPNAKPEKDP
jgi:hypothetical protein